MSLNEKKTVLSKTLIFLVIMITLFMFTCARVDKTVLGVGRAGVGLHLGFSNDIKTKCLYVTTKSYVLIRETTFSKHQLKVLIIKCYLGNK